MKEMLTDIRSKLQNGYYKNEEHVRLSLVARLLQQLDWNIWDPTEVNSEFMVVPHEDSTRVDLALFLRPSSPSVFMEVKAVGKLQGRIRDIERQVRDYNRNNPDNLFHTKLTEAHFAGNPVTNWKELIHCAMRAAH